MKKVVGYVADSSHHELSDPLAMLPLVAMYGGVALYLLAHVAFRLRNVHTVNKQRVVVAVLLLALLPAAAHIPALAALAVLTVVLVSLIAFEAVRFAEAREKIRHAAHG
jgi:low temperature requirement protein LtrA